MAKRSRDPLDDPRSGPSKNALRGLSYVDQKPSFLQNIGAALSGRAPPAAGSRPPVPTRPDNDGDGMGVDESDDELDGATVVVLKEGKHLDQDEVDRMRAHAKATDSLDPFVAGAAEPERVKNGGSLSFSSGTKGGLGGKGRVGSGAGQGDWTDVVKRSKEEGPRAEEGAGGDGSGVEAEGRAEQPPPRTAEDKAREEEKALKRKKKEKKKAQQKIGKLSFGEDE